MRSFLKPWWLVLVVFVILYVCISLVNHWCFRTYALDLGAYTAALYDYAHFQFHDSTSFKPVAENLLSDHFDLYLVLLSPLSWIFGTYTLLLVQIAAIGIGARGIYKLIQPQGEKMALLATVYFFSFFGMVSAVSFDYHSNVVAACFIPWLFFSIREQQLKKFLFFFLLIIVSRENLSLLMFVLLPCTLALQKNLSPAFKKWIWITAAFSLVYFVLVSAVIMPALSNTGKMYQFRYGVLGHGYTDAVKNLVTHPVDSFSLLFRNHSGVEKFDFIKTELWVYLLISGLGLFIFNWPFVVMLLPILAQKLFHDQPEIWGINDHYTAEMAPIMTIGVFYTIQRFGASDKMKKVWAYVMVGLSLALTIHLMDHPQSLVRKDNVRVYKSIHYQPVVDRDVFEKAAALVPANAAVSCQSMIHPHLAWRDKIYAFPVINDADYILLFTEDGFYPLEEKVYHEKVNLLKQDSHWKIILDKKGVLLLKKIR